MSNLKILTLMERMKNERVEAQRERFDAFMETANLQKIGKKWMEFMFKDAGDGKYNSHVYIHRILKRCANVHAAMYHPSRLRDGHNAFYCEILTQAAVKAYLDVTWNEVESGQPS